MKERIVVNMRSQIIQTKFRSPGTKKKYLYILCLIPPLFFYFFYILHKMNLIDAVLSLQFESYSFCPKCGVDVTIFCHEGDCPSYR